MILLVPNRPQRSPHKVRHLSPTRQMLGGSRIRETSQKRKAQRVRLHFKGSEVLLPKCSHLIRTYKGKRGFASAGVSEPITRPRCAEYAPIRESIRAGKTPTLKSHESPFLRRSLGESGRSVVKSLDGFFASRREYACRSPRSHQQPTTLCSPFLSLTHQAHPRRRRARAHPRTLQKGVA